MQWALIEDICIIEPDFFIKYYPQTKILSELTVILKLTNHTL